MAENDIYNNKARYEAFKRNVDDIVIQPKSVSKRKYYCKNSDNIQYFQKMFLAFESRDTSYIRRMRLLQTLKLITFATNIELSCCRRQDIDNIVAFMHSVYKSSKSKSDFIKDIKYIWKAILPDRDEKGRIDPSIVPYVVRHLSGKIDKSKERLRNDRLDFNQYHSIVNFFGDMPCVQSYITLAHESLGRPQEILFLKIRSVELHDNFAKLYITDHGKEGCGFLICIDSYPYLMRWLEQHPFKSDPDSYLFINPHKSRHGSQLTPYQVNQLLRRACNELNIDKRITCYSLKRNGVTFRKIRGESDVEIQHVARWTSTKQLSTYDYTNQEDMLKKQLIRKGLVKPGKESGNQSPKTKPCLFCKTPNGFGDVFCQSCKRPLDRERIVEAAAQVDRIHQMQDELSQIRQQLGDRNKFDGILVKLLSIPKVKQKYKELRKAEILG